MEFPERLRDERYCYLSTQMRVTGRRHTAELWFIPHEGGVFLMSGSGGLTQWCLNLQAEEQGVVRIGDASWLARSTFLTEEDPDRDTVLRAFHDKYDPEGKDRLDPWRRNATVVEMVFTRQV
ncbi:MAG: hypothetical protein KY461_10610 [Actinobacteria bacterium]|nr:hypothetical protein [Actinomycetota bacterium]